MKPAAILAALWPTLRDIALQLGRWVVETLADETVLAVAAYVRMRSRVFERRLERVLARRKRMNRRNPKRDVENWRVRWLRGRIRRWCRAAAWLESAAAAKLRGKVVTLAVERATREIPEHAPDESFVRWLRRQRK